MCQLIVKDFELCFGRIDPVSTPNERPSNGAHEYSNPDEHNEVPESAPEVKPFARKAKGAVLFVQAYLLPLEQLLELISHITGANILEINIPQRFSFQ